MVNPRPRQARDPHATPSAQPSVTSKAIAILAAFDSEHPRLALTELAKRAGLPVATTHRIAGELVHAEALAKVGREFVIGREIWRLGLLAPVRQNIAEVAAPYMQDVLFVTQNIVNLFVPDGDRALLVERISGTRAGTPFRQVGARMPLHASAAGKVMLAFGDPEMLSRVSRRLERHTANTITDADALAREIAAVKSRGYAATAEEAGPANYGLAVPIILASGTFVGALGVVTQDRPPARGTVIPVLRIAARSVARRLYSDSSSFPEDGLVASEFH
ncbi:IclR family transcriptional regulator [Salinibacterium sp. dk2585]|nr:IclR family transcriptional regulator [Salinibacterium sp. dk5596]QEE62610.1 IclR family transcriptional regulator [Salinibacterium sp. dk2585]TXK54207.1 IclR family transcriptional regulator [Salinibacterium sp. dk5596]